MFTFFHNNFVEFRRSMNQSLLTRLFKSIEGTPDDTLIKIAFSIIDDEKKKGHHKLAMKLNNILKNNLKPVKSHNPALKIAESSYKIPSDRRYNLPLATHIKREELRHHMILNSELEDKIRRIENEFSARDRLAKHGLTPRLKILLYGPSGCGKSMTAERIAWNLGLPFFKVRFDTIISSYLGESAANLNNLFRAIEDLPCVLLLDEFDIVAKQRGSGKQDVGEIDRIVNILLGLLEEYNAKGILIATTNLEGELDNAMFRRFDDIIQMPRPEINEIELLLKQSLLSINVDSEVKFLEIAEHLEGFSSALVVKIAHDAAKLAVIESKGAVKNIHFEVALKENLALKK